MTQWPAPPPRKPWSKRKTVVFVSVILTLYVGLISSIGVIGVALTHMGDAGKRLAEAGKRLSAVNAPATVSQTPSVPVTAVGPNHTNPSAYRWQLHSTKPFSEARIPFAYKCGQVEVASNTATIFVKATLAGKPALCLVDTGASNESWPQWLKLLGEHRSAGQATGINNSQRPTDTVTLANVHIGDYELSSLPTSMIKHKAKEQGVADVLPIIGDYALCHTVLTIDYRNKVMILRSPEYDVTRLPRAPQDILLDFEWISGCPSIRGTIEGHSAKLLIDTGCQPKIVVEKHFADAHLHDHEFTKHTTGGAFGIMQEACLDEAHCGVGSAKIADRNIGVTDLESRWDGIIGQQFLALYDVTIDYPRQKLLLHRNALRNTQKFNNAMTIRMASNPYW